ncbi:hypothetical protein P154DRAFT_598286 [Amniculicola lignicola CBS 123094]|uniref:Uncharacterized protein n=1 Tax=Amniculicola lignicola CBS 123094 TaxID=1392246 RepID=A0A6A5WIS0_9PLEO|nr:hypothetical protein P154DRAFT_598286 [Amniculicola lignicola CBS 123094]
MVFEPPIERPDGSDEDDESCKNSGQKPDCDDCGGNNPLGMCSSGSQQNCPCEEQQCPTDSPPSCPAPECSGNCCRSEAPKYEDEQCKGDDDEKCKSGKYNGCRCQLVEFPEQDVSVDEPFPDIPDEKQLQISRERQRSTANVERIIQ